MSDLSPGRFQVSRSVGLERQAKTIKSIKTKLKDNESMIAHTDKGNSLMIIPIQQYESKI